MKKSRNTLIACILIFLLTASTTILFAQPPPPPSDGHGLGNDSPPGAGAPIGEGLFLLIGLAGLYAGKKILDQRKKSEI